MQGSTACTFHARVRRRPTPVRPEPVEGWTGSTALGWRDDRTSTSSVRTDCGSTQAPKPPVHRPSSSLVVADLLPRWYSQSRTGRSAGAPHLYLDVRGRHGRSTYPRCGFIFCTCARWLQRPRRRLSLRGHCLWGCPPHLRRRRRDRGELWRLRSRLLRSRRRLRRKPSAFAQDLRRPGVRRRAPRL